MSNAYGVTSHATKGMPVGVTGLGIPKESYSPLSHNPPAPIRPGATDAFKCNSIDHTGASLPYWANKDEP